MESHRDVLQSKENKAGSTVISKYTYGVNAIGQRTSVANSGSAFASAPGIGWGYNARGEVVSAAHSDSTQSRFYGFDAMGNRTISRKGVSIDSGGARTSSVPNSLNQYSAIGSTNPTYDLDGNQLSSRLPKDPTNGVAYVWDGENRLLEAKVSGATVGRYQYDPFGRRIFKDGYLGQKRWFFYDGWNPIAEHTDGVLKRSHLWGLDLSASLQGAGGVGGLLSGNYQDVTLNGRFHPLYDANGNAVQYLDSSAGSGWRCCWCRNL